MAMSPRHPFHEHPLIDRELSGKCTVHCNHCGDRINGSTSCCLECEAFFHKTCTEWPLQVLHPSHPQHHLALVTGNYLTSNYCCHECCFSASAADIVSTLPPAEKQVGKSETIEHFAHEHPLEYFSVTSPNNIRCRACKQGISSSVYGCRECMFLLHESCAQLPQEILQHPFHKKHSLTLHTNSEKQFKCNACGRSHEYAYHCNECRFDLDVLCAVSTLPLQDQQNGDSVMIDHFSHPHQLKSCNIKEESNRMTCKACAMHLSGEVYGCLDCIFFLHKSCAELHTELGQSLHPDHNLQAKFHENAGKFRCSCCSEASSGFAYSCEMCNFNLDIECALGTLSVPKEEAAKLQHFAHDHLLSLLYFKGDNGPNCNACMQPVHGLCYCCLTCKSFVLHKSHYHMSKELEHPFHPQHPLTILSRPREKRYFYCNACNRKSTGFTYHCAECNFFLDIKCASTKPSRKHELHEHHLTYFERAAGLHCFYCGRSCNTDLYRCVPCNFNLHDDCLPLPPTFQPGSYHHHPLTLRDKYIFELVNAQYCYVCEEFRNTDHGVYVCKEGCIFAAHIPCIILMARPERRKPIESPQLDALEKEIANLKAEIEGRTIKLERLTRKRADMDLQSLKSLEFEEGSLHETSKEEVESEDHRLTELKKLDDEIASLDAPIKELKKNMEMMRRNLEDLQNKQLELKGRRASMISRENKEAEMTVLESEEQPNNFLSMVDPGHDA